VNRRITPCHTVYLKRSHLTGGPPFRVGRSRPTPTASCGAPRPCSGQHLRREAYQCRLVCLKRTHLGLLALHGLQRREANQPTPWVSGVEGLVCLKRTHFWESATHLSPQCGQHRRRGANKRTPSETNPFWHVATRRYSCHTRARGYPDGACLDSRFRENERPRSRSEPTGIAGGRSRPTPTASCGAPHPCRGQHRRREANQPTAWATLLRTFA
jgi:hypothetical protein